MKKYFGCIWCYGWTLKNIVLIPLCTRLSSKICRWLPTCDQAWFMITCMSRKAS